MSSLRTSPFQSLAHGTAFFKRYLPKKPIRNQLICLGSNALIHSTARHYEKRTTAHLVARTRSPSPILQKAGDDIITRRTAEPRLVDEGKSEPAVTDTASGSSLESTVARGTRFERGVQAHLSSLGMQLDRIGGRDDQGTDLLGWWKVRWPLRTSDGGTAGEPAHLPKSAGLNMRVIVQCKAEKKPLGPKILRELEGTLHRATWTGATANLSESRGSWWSPAASQGSSWPGLDASSDEAVPLVQIGVLASLGGFSKRTIQNSFNAPMPIILLHLAEWDSATVRAQHDASRSTSSRPLKILSFLPNQQMRRLLAPAVSSFATIHFYPDMVTEKQTVAPCIFWHADVYLPGLSDPEPQRH